MDKIVQELIQHSAWLLIPVVLLGFHYQDQLSRRWRSLLLGLMLAAIPFYAVQLIHMMQSQVANPPEWDFQFSWLHGRVAAQGLNYVDMVATRQLAETLHPSTTFLKELDFPFLPPTIFLYLWLGWFNFQTAYGLWYVFHSLFLLLDALLLYRIFLPGSGVMGGALVLLLLLTLPGTGATFWFGQTNFLVLFGLLLLLQYRDRPLGGIGLALGTFTKPYVLLLLPYAVVKKRWRVVLGMLGTLAAGFLLTLVVFGPGPLVSYFTKDPSERAESAYLDPINQSLLSTILRLTGEDVAGRSPILHPLYLAIALSLCAVTGWLVLRLENRHSGWAIALVLITILIIYPGTLTHYSVQLIIPILLLWQYRQQLFWGIWGVSLFVLLQYTLSQFSNYLFVLLVLDWCILAGVCFYIPKGKKFSTEVVISDGTVGEKA